ncbi:MAG: hypothetical protein MK085_02075, partial [Phycisphaerales bacterium]|nr:hypothetical protein [Phycisphaerales bacterium]
MHRFIPGMLVFIMAGMCAGCSGKDPVGFRIHLTESADLRGDLVVASLSVPGLAMEENPEVQGVKWSVAAKLVVTSGTFEDLSKVQFSDVRIEANRYPSGSGAARIELPTGNTAEWFK